jgi:hypothetical protein
MIRNDDSEFGLLHIKSIHKSTNKTESHFQFLVNENYDFIVMTKSDACSRQKMPINKGDNRSDRIWKEWCLFLKSFPDSWVLCATFTIMENALTWRLLHLDASDYPRTCPWAQLSHLPCQLDPPILRSGESDFAFPVGGALKSCFGQSTPEMCIHPWISNNNDNYYSKIWHSVDQQ